MYAANLVRTTVGPRLHITATPGQYGAVTSEYWFDCPVQLRRPAAVQLTIYPAPPDPGAVNLTGPADEIDALIIETLRPHTLHTVRCPAGLWR